MQIDTSYIKKPLKKRPRTSSFDWKLLAYIITLIACVIIFNFVEPAKEFLLNLGDDIEDLSFFGPLLFIAFLGFIVIPFGLPYLAMECALAMIYSEFTAPFAIALCSKFVGCTFSYILVKNHFRQRIEAWLEKERVFQSVQKLINESPWKFSCLFRVILMPYMIKNYGLALPSRMNYFIYIVTAVAGGGLASALNITLVQQTRTISEDYFSYVSLDWYNVVILVLTIITLLYVIYYTVKTMRQLNDDDRASRSGISIELDATDHSVLENDMESRDRSSS
jgi:uncharacterized membrane protein YdjX (TVP38/TMEM64 family)